MCLTHIMVVGGNPTLTVTKRLREETNNLLRMAFHTFRLRTGNAGTLILVAPSRIPRLFERLASDVLSDVLVVEDRELVSPPTHLLLERAPKVFEHIRERIILSRYTSVIIIPDHVYVNGLQIHAVKEWLYRSERSFPYREVVAGLIDIHRGTFENATIFPLSQTTLPTTENL